ncbi:MAG: DUF5801 repeats-in-toxin domain-containing protein, partial [Sphingorhabdus sp.]
TVTDTDGDTDTEPFTITIVDDTPTAHDDSVTQTAENAPVTINVIANDVPGADGVSLTSGVALIAGSLSGAGSIVYNNDGTFTYMPAPGEEGLVTFQYRITDGDGDTSTATATIALLTDSVPRIAIEGDSDVNEAGLPARGSEPAGSDAASNSEIASGMFNMTIGNDGVGSLFVNGIDVSDGGSVTGASGTLIVNRSDSAYSYVYTLSDNTSGDAAIDTFTVALIDSDGDVATDTLVITIADDAPTAVADTDSVAAGQYGPATGNVVSDAEGDGGADTQGADGVVVSAVSGTGAGVVGGPTMGQYGILTLNTDGSYSYVRNAGTPGGVSDIFSYTIRDGDGDISTATLTISIADSPTGLDLPVNGEAGTQVAEAGLPTGSNAASNDETTTGTIAYAAPDGPATVTIDGVAVAAVGQLFNGSFGTLTITSIADGVIGYSYTLITNTSGDGMSDDFAVVVTDQDGDSTSGTLVIDIVDDMPTARPDTDSVAEDNFVDEEGNPQADGNVLTGAGGFDANSTDGVADTPGADGASVTGVRFGATAGSVGTGLSGAYGELVLKADGSYSYTLNNFDPAIQGLDSDDSLTEVFHYTITDGDGDIRETALTIIINGSDDPIVIGRLNVEGPELIVDEDDLFDGSSPNTPALTKTGIFTVEGQDGIASIKIEGGDVAIGQSFTTAHGVFAITSISAPVDGSATSIVIGYSYVLTDNTAHPSADGQNFLAEFFDIEVTDTDGSTDSDTIEVRIIDDIPMAIADSDTIPGGSSAAATGNVVTDIEGDGGADTIGADGAVVTNVTGTAAGTVGGTTPGQYGVLTLNADGSYSYTRDSGSPGNVSDVFTYSITDADGDISTSTLTITILDAAPVVGPNATVLLDDDALMGGNPDGIGDDPDAVNIVGTLSGTGGDGALSWTMQTYSSTLGLTAALLGPGLLHVFQGATHVLTITVDGGTGIYTVTQLARIDHPAGGEENEGTFTLNYIVTDVDGDAAPGSIVINLDDDTPTATVEAPLQIVEDSAMILSGNVLANDSSGADGGRVTSVSVAGVTVAVSAVGVTNHSNAQGSYAFQANGDWTFDPNANLNAASGTDASFSYILTDGDGDTVSALQPIFVLDGAGPTAGPPVTLVLDDQNLADGRTPAGPDFAADTIIFTPGSDAIASILFSTDLATLGGGLDWVRVDGTTIIGSNGANPILTLTLSVAGNAATVTATLNDNYSSHPITNLDDLVDIGSVGVVATDMDGDGVMGMININISDDIPSVTAVNAQPILVVDETVLAVDATASFAGVFATAFGADGMAASNSIAYALGADAGPSGLIDVATGEAVNLVLNGTIVEGRTAATGQLVFTVAVDAAGNVSLDQVRAVRHDDTTDPDESGASAATLGADNLIRLVATVTDRDGDSATASINIGQNLQFEDDGPSVTATGAVPMLTVDETTLASNAGPISFAGIFGVAYGADGAGSTAYTVSVDTGIASGLVDTETGQTVVLSLAGNIVTGRAGSGGPVVFILTADTATGELTLDQQRAVAHNVDGGPSTAHDDPVSLASGAILLTATATDRDGDSDSATVQIGTRLVFEDDGPTLTAGIAANGDLTVDETALAINDTANLASLFTPSYGADGAGSVGNFQLGVSIQGAASGVFDIATGNPIFLFLEAGTVVGRTGTNAGTAAGGSIAFTVSVDGAGVATLDQVRAVSHSPDTGPNQPVQLASAGLITLTATVTDGDGDTNIAIASIGNAITFLDDTGVLGAFNGVTVINGTNVVGNGTFIYSEGADGHGSFGITGPSLPGISYTTVQNASGALLTATTDPDGAGGNPPITVFTLQVNSNGTYAFTLVTPQAATTETISLLGLSAGGPSPFVETPNGRVEFTGSGSGINSSTQGFGVANQFVGNGESFTIEFHDPGQVGDQPALTNPDFVSSVVLRNDNINGSLTIRVTVFNDVLGTSEVVHAGLNVTGAFTTIDPIMSEFNRVLVEGIGGNGNGVRFTSLDISRTILPSDIDLAFNINATDRDGDTTSTSVLNVFVDATASAARAFSSGRMALTEESPNGLMPVAANENETRSPISGINGIAASMVAAGLIAATTDESPSAGQTVINTVDIANVLDGNAGNIGEALQIAENDMPFDGFGTDQWIDNGIPPAASTYVKSHHVEDMGQDDFGFLEEEYGDLITGLLAPTEIDQAPLVRPGFAIGSPVDTALHGLIAGQEFHSALEGVVADALTGGATGIANVDAVLTALAGPADQLPLLGDTLALQFGDMDAFNPSGAIIGRDAGDPFTIAHMEIAAASGQQS